MSEGLTPEQIHQDKLLVKDVIKNIAEQRDRIPSSVMPFDKSPANRAYLMIDDILDLLGDSIDIDEKELEDLAKR